MSSIAVVSTMFELSVKFRHLSATRPQIPAGGPRSAQHGWSVNYASYENTLRLAHAYVYGVVNCDTSSRDELLFVEKLLEDTVRRLRRVFGISHPSTARAEEDLTLIRQRLAEP